MADKMTDNSNQEQFVLCLRWVDEDLNLHEEFIGLHVVPNICADTLVACIRDTLIRMNLSIQNCRDQCYEEASNMAGSKSGIAAQTKTEEPRIISTHWYGHSLQLAVGDTVKEIKNLKDTLDTTSEFSNLLKYSPKRDAMLRKLKEQLAPTTPGFQTLYPTRWTVRAASLQSVIDNWKVLQDLWEECLATKLEPDFKGRVIGVQYQMTSFDYFFGVNLAILLLKRSDNLSCTLQDPDMSMVECQSVTTLTTSTLAKIRSDQRFALFWEKSKEQQTVWEYQHLFCLKKGNVRQEILLGTLPQNSLKEPKNIIDGFILRQSTLLSNASNPALIRKIIHKRTSNWKVFY